MIIRIEGISSAPCSYAWYIGDLTLFLWGLIIGLSILAAWRGAQCVVSDIRFLIALRRRRNLERANG
jgi:hypothetical protein